MTLNLDPGIKAYIERAIELYDDEAEHGSIADQRKAYLDLCRAFVAPYPTGVRASDQVIDADGRRIPVRIYRPSVDAALPCVLFFHGGGCIGGARSRWPVRRGTGSDLSGLRPRFRLAVLP
ncbi:MAG: hypothetical protein ACREEE_06355 [Dongiaceae bacterium]